MANFDKEHQSKGSLFTNDRKEGNQPDYTGYIEVTGAQLRRLVELGKSGHEVKLQVSAWHKTAKSGTEYIFVSADVQLPKQKRSQSEYDDIPF